MAKKLHQSELDQRHENPPAWNGDGNVTERSGMDGMKPGELAVDANGQLEPAYPAGCLMLRQGAPQEEWPTSLQVGSPRWRAALVNADCTPDLEVGNDWSEPFIVTDWLVKWRDGVDEETGEARQYPWLVLFCANGDVIGTSSQVVPHQLARALRIYGPDEWKKGIAFKIRRRLSRNGKRSYHELRVCE